MSLYIQNLFFAMTSSPTKNAVTSFSTSTQQLSSPRTAGRLRKLQSAHQLSSQYNASNGPSLISQQRQQQQRNTSTSQAPPVPSIPLQHSPQRHNRTRSNSDAAVPSFAKPTTSPKRPTVTRKPTLPKDAKHELEVLMRQGPKDDVPLALQNLRHWILCDGMDADSDGMVCFPSFRLSAYVYLLSSSPICVFTSGLSCSMHHLYQPTLTLTLPDVDLLRPMQRYVTTRFVPSRRTRFSSVESLIIRLFAC